MRVAMARPAASSFALLMRLPLDRRSIACDCMLLATRELFWARSALTLVLMTVIMFLSGPTAIPLVRLDERHGTSNGGRAARLNTCRQKNAETGHVAMLSGINILKSIDK